MPSPLGLCGLFEPDNPHHSIGNFVLPQKYVKNFVLALKKLSYGCFKFFASEVDVEAEVKIEVRSVYRARYRGGRRPPF